VKPFLDVALAAILATVDAPTQVTDLHIFAVVHRTQEFPPQ
jgi:hypothetical protein